MSIQPLAALITTVVATMITILAILGWTPSDIALVFESAAPVVVAHLSRAPEQSPALPGHGVL